MVWKTFDGVENFYLWPGMIANDVKIYILNRSDTIKMTSSKKYGWKYEVTWSQLYLWKKFDVISKIAPPFSLTYSILVLWPFIIANDVQIYILDRSDTIEIPSNKKYEVTWSQLYLWNKFGTAPLFSLTYAR